MNIVHIVVIYLRTYLEFSLNTKQCRDACMMYDDCSEVQLQCCRSFMVLKCPEKDGKSEVKRKFPCGLL